jgi:uncharacterized membrane protein (DUF485 family)
MTDDLVARAQASPAYRTLVRRRTRLAWILTAAILLAYFGYVALIAFDKALMAKPIGGGVMSIGIPLGFGLIIFTVALTGIYVWRANAEFDALTRQVAEELGE